MRTAFVLHLYYPEESARLAMAVSALDCPGDVFITGPCGRDEALLRRLRDSGRRVEVVTTENRGRDIGPFVDLLPRLASTHDLVCKLHTKGDRSGYGREWRQLLRDGLIEASAVRMITEAFASNPLLMMAGPEALYKSSARHMFRNRAAVLRLTERLWPDALPPSNWGFFAGTMFWARLSALSPLSRMAASEFDDEAGVHDGGLEHAAERIFGLASVIDGGQVGLLPPAGGPLSIVGAGEGGDSFEQPLIQTLARTRFERLAERHRLIKDDPAITAQILRSNPLLDYLQPGRRGEHDPNLLFHNRWFAEAYALDESTGPPLAQYLRSGKIRQNPSPLFDLRAQAKAFKKSGKASDKSLDPLGWRLTRSVPDPDNWAPRRSAVVGAGLHDVIDDREREWVGSLPALRAKDHRVSIIFQPSGSAEDDAAAVRSIQAQSHVDWELLLLGPAAPEAVVGTDDARIRFVESPQASGDHASHAVAAATGQAVCWIEPGDRWPPWRLRAQLAFIDRAGLDGASCVIEYVDRQDNLAAYLRGDWTVGAVAPPRLGTLLMRRAALDHVDLSVLQRAFGETHFVTELSRGRRMGAAPFVGVIRKGALPTSTPRPLRKLLLSPGEAKSWRMKACGDPVYAGALRQALLRAGYPLSADTPDPDEGADLIFYFGLPAAAMSGQAFTVLLPLAASYAATAEACAPYDLVIVGEPSDAALLILTTATPADAVPATPDVNDQRGWDHWAEGLLSAIAAHFGEPLETGGGDRTATQKKKALRVFALTPAGRRGFRSSAYIRLIAPLSQVDVDLDVRSDMDLGRMDEVDVLIVQRDAAPDLHRAQQIVRTARRSGVPIIMDVDDALTLLDQGHPDFESYRPKLEAFSYLIGEADQLWVATAALHDLYRPQSRDVRLVANGLDRRLWPDREPVSWRSGPLELLYMGTATHDADFEMILPELDGLYSESPGAFRLTIIGAVSAPPERPWLKVLNPPPGMGPYPHFARWLSRQGPFHLGLAPLRATPFNACKSDIKLLDYAALGVPAVLSDVPAYSGHAGTGRAWLTGSASGNWRECLESVIHQPQLIEETALAARTYVWSERTGAQLGALQQALLKGLVDSAG